MRGGLSPWQTLWVLALAILSLVGIHVLVTRVLGFSELSSVVLLIPTAIVTLGAVAVGLRYGRLAGFEPSEIKARSIRTVGRARHLRNVLWGGAVASANAYLVFQLKSLSVFMIVLMTVIILLANIALLARYYGDYLRKS